MYERDTVSENRDAAYEEAAGSEGLAHTQDWMNELRDAEPTPAELAYYAELEADQRRAQSRAGQRAPHVWGARLDAEHYFCTTCWYNGFETGAHPDSIPPCDPLERVPNWA